MPEGGQDIVRHIAPGFQTVVMGIRGRGGHREEGGGSYGSTVRLRGEGEGGGG